MIFVHSSTQNHGKYAIRIKPPKYAFEPPTYAFLKHVINKSRKLKNELCILKLKMRIRRLGASGVRKMEVPKFVVKYMVAVIKSH